jgi:hypothetical protein
VRASTQKPGASKTAITSPSHRIFPERQVNIIRNYDYERYAHAFNGWGVSSFDTVASFVNFKWTAHLQNGLHNLDIRLDVRIRSEPSLISNQDSVSGSMNEHPEAVHVSKSGQ